MVDICKTCEIEPGIEREDMEQRTIKGEECLVCPNCESVIDNLDAERLGGVFTMED